jgi:hypothetical protein
MTRTDHRGFCEHEGWERADADHHLTYALRLPGGLILHTRISHPVTKQAYSPRLAAHILRDQLQVSADEFWACAADKVVPARSVVTPTAGPTLPAGLLMTLKRELALSDAELAVLSKVEAVQMLNAHWAVD